MPTCGGECVLQAPEHHRKSLIRRGKTLAIFSEALLKSSSKHPNHIEKPHRKSLIRRGKTLAFFPPWRRKSANKHWKPHRNSRCFKMILECFRHGRGPHKTSWIALRSLRKKSTRPQETQRDPRGPLWVLWHLRVLLDFKSTSWDLAWLETWFEIWLETWVETWLEAWLEAWLETWLALTLDLRLDLRIYLRLDSRLDVRLDLRFDLGLDLKLDLRDDLSANKHWKPHRNSRRFKMILDWFW